MMVLAATAAATAAAATAATAFQAQKGIARGAPRHPRLVIPY